MDTYSYLINGQAQEEIEEYMKAEHDFDDYSQVGVPSLSMLTDQLWDIECINAEHDFDDYSQVGVPSLSMLTDQLWDIECINAW